jgi:hypothetical protein
MIFTGVEKLGIRSKSKRISSKTIKFFVHATPVALHLTVVKLTCNENGVQTYSSWYASTHSQEDYHGPHNYILPQ